MPLSVSAREESKILAHAGWRLMPASPGTVSNFLAGPTHKTFLREGREINSALPWEYPRLSMQDRIKIEGVLIHTSLGDLNAMRNRKLCWMALYCELQSNAVFLWVSKLYLHKRKIICKLLKLIPWNTKLKCHLLPLWKPFIAESQIHFSILKLSLQTELKSWNEWWKNIYTLKLVGPSINCQNKGIIKTLME
jgi:hypothetical protein